jgi:hypothetical protein
LNPAKRAFLLLIFGFETLSWFFPLGPVVILFGFVTVWAVVDFKWAVALSLWGDIPDYYNQAVAMYYIVTPLIPKLQLMAKNCSGLAANRTLQDACDSKYLNVTNLPISFPKALPSIPGHKPIAFKFPSWLPWAMIIGVIPLDYYFIIRPFIRMKRRIREATRRYQFRA